MALPLDGCTFSCRDGQDELYWILNWNEREVSSRDVVGVHVESQFWSGTACVRGSGTAVLSVEFADGFRTVAVADHCEAYGGGSPKRLYDCVPYSFGCGDWIHHELHRFADVVQAV